MQLIPIRDHNPYRRFPFITIALIAVNVWVFFAVGIDERTAFQLGAIPCDLVGRCDVLSHQLEQTFPGRSPWVTIFTSMFMHGGIAHIAGNMLYLWVFGNNVEDRMGHVGYTAFYAVTGLAAALTHILLFSGSQTPVVGASGAVSGVLGAYFVMFPRARVTSLVPFLFFIPVEVSAGFLLGMWFVMQLMTGLIGVGAAQGGGGGVAFFAHVGGFAAGWILTRIFYRPRRRPDPVEAWFAR